MHRAMMHDQMENEKHGVIAPCFSEQKQLKLPKDLKQF